MNWILVTFALFATGPVPIGPAQKMQSEAECYKAVYALQLTLPKLVPGQLGVQYVCASNK